MYRLFRSSSQLISKSRFYSSKAQRLNFAKINENDVNIFKNIVGNSSVLTDPSDIEGYRNDWIGKYKGEGSVVLRPKNAKQVSEILKHCNERKLAVVPQGGNTGLVGGSIPVHDEIVLSTSLMNEIEEFDEDAGIVTCGAGVVLEQLATYLAPQGYTVPLDLGAKGSCQIGGNVSTNAGGIRFLRYGSLHGSVAGLEVVLANGEILNLLSNIRKDNTGYDLKQLFIGAEGTLGVVTRVALVAPPKPIATNVAVFALNSFEDVLKLLKVAKSTLGEVLSAFEFFDALSLELVEKYNGGKSPVKQSPFYVLIETAGSNNEHDATKLDGLLELAFGEGSAEKPIVIDGALASSETQAASMWQLREGLAEALKKSGACYKYDLSIPIKQFYSVVESMREQFKSHPECIVCGYGHVGDGNLHLNIAAPEYNEEYLNLIEPFVYQLVSDMGGSVSAEHGLGQMKPQHIHFSKSNVAVDIMRQIKTTLDPNAILNPYKVLPPKE